MSSMVIEFTRKEDLKQACYEATLDLNLYLEHIKNIAVRCQKNFPEVTAGLMGSYSGISQYLRGIDGEWKTNATKDLREVLNNERFMDHQWAYEFARDPRCAQLLLGFMAAVAAAKPKLTFWEVLAASRERLSETWGPLIERLMASSPMRKKQ